MDANKLKLIEYLALPKAFRPMSLKAFAKEVLGVSEPTIHAWKNEQDVAFSVRKTINNRFADDIPDVLMALRDNAMAGNPGAARLFLEYVNDRSPSEERDMPRPRLSIKEVKEEIEKLTRKYYPKTSHTSRDVRYA